MATSVESLVYESPEDRHARRFTREWEGNQKRADQFLANNSTYQGLYSRYLALVEVLQARGINRQTKKHIGEMNLLGGQMGIIERVAAAFHTPILTGEYPRDLHLPP